MKKVIKKSVCLKCKDTVASILKMESQPILTGTDKLVCEWCDEPIKKFSKHIQFYIEKGDHPSK